MSELSVLLVEDEANLGQTLRDYLRAKSLKLNGQARARKPERSSMN